MPRTTIVLPASTGDVTVTTSQTNLLVPGSAITAGSLDNGVPINNVESYSLVVANTGATDITLTFWLAAGRSAGLRAQSTTTVAAGAVWTYQFSGNAAQALALTAVTASSTTTVRADMVGVVYA